MTPNPKPFNASPPSDPAIGYSVIRRADGGMHYVFTKSDGPTVTHWREFAAQHLLTADHNTRNLYDLRPLAAISAEALHAALEMANDPAARNVRTAIVVSGPAVAAMLKDITVLSERGNLRVFTELDEAEAWLAQPFSRLLKQERHP
jgi:hypothetical protein